MRSTTDLQGKRSSQHPAETPRDPKLQAKLLRIGGTGGDSVGGNGTGTADEAVSVPMSVNRV